MNSTADPSLSTHTKSWSPPRPAGTQAAATVADLHGAIKRIEERRSGMASLSTPIRQAGIGGGAAANSDAASGTSSLLMVTPSGLPSAVAPFQHHRATLHQQQQPQSSTRVGTHLTSPPHASPATSGAAPAGTATSTTEAALLRLDLEHKRGELDLKRKAIGKLEEEHLRLLNEISELRQRESEKRDAAAVAHRQELSRERNAVAELQSQLSVEVARRGAAEREVAALVDSKTRAQELEQQLRTTRELLRDREQELAAAQAARHAADERLNEAVAGDQTHVLRGRMKELEVRWEQANAQLDGVQHALADEHRRRAEVEQSLAERDRDLSTMRDQLAMSQVNVAELQESIRSKDSEIARLVERLDGLHSQFREAEHEQVKKVLLAQQEADESRAESRKRTQQMYQLESSLIEAFEKQKRAEDEREALGKAIEDQRAEMSALAQRLRSSHETIEERESELAKHLVLRQELKSQLVAQKSAVETLQAALATAASTERQLRDALAEFADVRTEKAAAEELCAVLRRALLERDAEMSAEHEATTVLRERLGAAEQQIVACQQALSAKQDVERRAGMREEELAVLRADLKVSELRESALKEDVAAVRQSLLVAETRAAVERDRREELEKKLYALERAAQDSFGTYGKFVALQQYLTSATSEGAKAAELNHALLDEVKMLETRCRDQERTISEQQQVIDELGKFSDLAESLERDLSRTLNRAREAEEREAELRRRMREDSSFNRHRMQELEVLFLEASRRSAAGRGGGGGSPSSPRRGSPEAETGGGGDARAQLLPPSGRRQGSSTAFVESPLRPETRRSADGGEADDSGQDEGEVSSASDEDEEQRPVARRLHADEVAEEDRRITVAPSQGNRRERRSVAQTAHETIANSDLVLRELTSAKEEKGKLEVQLSVLQEKYVQQDTRMEQLSQQFAAALGEIKRLKSRVPDALKPHRHDVTSASLESPNDDHGPVPDFHDDAPPALKATSPSNTAASSSASSSLGGRNVRAKPSGNHVARDRVRSPPPASSLSSTHTGPSGAARGPKEAGGAKERASAAVLPLEIARAQRNAELHRDGHDLTAALPKSSMTPSPARRSADPHRSEQRLQPRTATAGRPPVQHDSVRDRMEQLFRHAQQYAFKSPSPKPSRDRNDSSASPQRELTAVLSPSR